LPESATRRRRTTRSIPFENAARFGQREQTASGRKQLNDPVDPRCLGRKCFPRFAPVDALVDRAVDGREVRAVPGRISDDRLDTGRRHTAACSVPRVAEIIRPHQSGGRRGQQPADPAARQAVNIRVPRQLRGDLPAKRVE
jgi:hypothetical protein